jgi:molybdopterin converting factor small subunit
VKVHVEFLGLNFAIPKSRMDVEFSGETIADLIGQLSMGMKEFKEAVLKEDGSMDEAVQIGLNEEEWIPPDEVNKTKLKHGDRVMFMMMAGGG